MRIQAMFVILAQLSVVGYAVWAVHHRTDRRKVPEHFSGALHGCAAFACIVMLVALFLGEAAGARKFLAVREIFEIGFLSCCATIGLALRILKGAPYDREKKGEQ